MIGRVKDDRSVLCQDIFGTLILRHMFLAGQLRITCKSIRFFEGEGGRHLCCIVLGNTRADIVKEASFRGLCIFTATQLSMCGGVELVNELLE